MSLYLDTGLNGYDAMREHGDCCACGRAPEEVMSDMRTKFEFGEMYRLYIAVIPSKELFYVFEGRLESVCGRLSADAFTLEQVTLREATRIHCVGNPTHFDAVEVDLTDKTHGYALCVRGFSQEARDKHGY